MGPEGFTGTVSGTVAEPVASSWRSLPCATLTTAPALPGECRGMPGRVYHEVLWQPDKGSWLKASPLDPFQNLPLGKSDIRLDTDIRNQSTLHVAVNRLDANLEELLQFLGGEHFST